jgi:hypothetical protein
MLRFFFAFLGLLGVLETSVLASECPDAKTAKVGFILERRGTRAEIRPASDHLGRVDEVDSQIT